MKTFQDLKKTLLNKNPFKRFNTSNKHTKLYEQQSFEHDNQEQVFYSHYIGNTILSYDSHEGNATSCINRVIETAKLYKNKNRKKVLIYISVKGFKVCDCDTSADIIDASIYRVSYVTVSKTHKNIYAFIYQNPLTKLIECHAFDCKTKHYAKRILRTSFIAFNLAYDKYYKEKDVKKRTTMLGETQVYGFEGKTSYVEPETKDIQKIAERRSSILSKICLQEARNCTYITRKWLTRAASCRNHSKSEYSKLENSENEDYDYYLDSDDFDSDEDDNYTGETDDTRNRTSIMSL